MQETNQKELMEAIRVFKERYGIKTPLDLFRMDAIIEELKQEHKKVKRKGSKK